MDKKKIITIVIILVVAILAIFAIVSMGGKSNDKLGLECYKGKVSKDFDDKLINNYKEMRKFIKETNAETATKGYESYNIAEKFNEEYFQTQKVAAISIYEDNTSYYEYHVDDVKYNEDHTIATIEFTNKKSGYDGNLSASWINFLLVELEGTVEIVNFTEVTE